jgi:hypothetical protein
MTRQHPYTGKDGSRTGAGGWVKIEEVSEQELSDLGLSLSKNVLLDSDTDGNFGGFTERGSGGYLTASVLEGISSFSQLTRVEDEDWSLLETEEVCFVCVCVCVCRYIYTYIFYVCMYVCSGFVLVWKMRIGVCWRPRRCGVCECVCVCVCVCVWESS